ncbi:MAG: FAD-dependent oxidoreductase [Bacteroidales bacterium]
MKRRSFLNRLLLSSGALLTATQCKPGPDAPPAVPPAGTPDPGTATSSTVREPARDLPVVADVDVLVVGGGPAGTTAAISASRAGAKTLLVERYNHLGGLWTGGLVLPLLSTHGLDQNQKQVRTLHGIGNEMYERLRDLNMTVFDVNPSIDPEAGKYVLEVMLQESGTEVYYHSWASQVLVEDQTIRAVFLETKSGRVAVRPKVVVDCTGDGDILHWCGENFVNVQYEIGLVHRLGNVDRVNKEAPGYRDLPLGGQTPLPSVNWVNMTGGPHEDALDFRKLSALQRQHRIDIWEQVQEIRSTPGHEEVFLLDTAPQQGVRMSRVLDGMYRLSLKDSMTYRRFDDAIGISGGWTSVLYEGRRTTWDKRPLWQIPFRSLVPKNTRNLLVGGRCFSFEEDLFQDARIIGTCLITGHGAGAGAALAARSATAVQELDPAAVRSLLKEQKAVLA